LLICQLEGLDLSFSLKWFFFLYFKNTVSETDLRIEFRVFMRAKTAKTFYLLVTATCCRFLTALGMKGDVVVAEKNTKECTNKQGYTILNCTPRALNCFSIT